jgi:hypothetical protein
MKNFWLFQILKKRFKNLQVHKEGESIVFVNDHLLDWGETYSVACPFCNDRKSHLYFSYVFGLKIGQKRLFPVKCFRRDCLKNKNNLEELKNLILNSNYFGIDLSQNQIQEERKISNKSNELSKFYNLPQLKCLPPIHPAVNYFNSRGLDYKSFENIDIRVCDNPEDELFGRIVFPISKIDRSLIGWVARAYLSGIKPKYLNSKSSKITHSFFNIENVIGNDYVIVVEGVFDALTLLSFKLPAIASLGCKLSRVQLELLEQNFCRKFILFDKDALVQAKKFASQLSGGFVIECKDYDPSDYGREDIQTICNFIQRVSSKED